jgi:hypothetical protein
LTVCQFVVIAIVNNYCECEYKKWGCVCARWLLYFMCMCVMCTPSFSIWSATLFIYVDVDGLGGVSGVVGDVLDIDIDMLDGVAVAKSALVFLSAVSV